MENNENIKPKRGRRSKKTIEEEKLNAEKNVHLQLRLASF